MGIELEFNPDLALRKRGTRGRSEHECLPKRLEKGIVYHFLKKGRREHWLEGEIPLYETKGEGPCSRPLAAIMILEETHFMTQGVLYTRGTYKIMEVFSKDDPTIHFEGYQKIKR